MFPRLYFSFIYLHLVCCSDYKTSKVHFQGRCHFRPAHCLWEGLGLIHDSRGVPKWEMPAELDHFSLTLSQPISYALSSTSFPYTHAFPSLSLANTLSLSVWQTLSFTYIFSIRCVPLSLSLSHHSFIYFWRFFFAYCDTPLLVNVPNFINNMSITSFPICTVLSVRWKQISIQVSPVVLTSSNAGQNVGRVSIIVKRANRFSQFSCLDSTPLKAVDLTGSPCSDMWQTWKLHSTKKKKKKKERKWEKKIGKAKKSIRDRRKELCMSHWFIFVDVNKKFKMAVNGHILRLLEKPSRFEVFVQFFWSWRFRKVSDKEEEEEEQEEQEQDWVKTRSLRIKMK